MDDQNERTTKPTKRATTPKSTGQARAPKPAAPTSTGRAPAPKRAAPKPAAPTSTRPKRTPKADATGPVAQRASVDAVGDGAPSRDEMSIAFTPGQMAVGGAIVAGLLVFGVRLLLGRRRGRG